MRERATGGEDRAPDYLAGMFTRPDEPTDRQLVAAVVDGWGLRVEDLAYLPVGFGSYHWRLTTEGTPWSCDGRRP
jgi:hypothetical protein